MSFFWVHGGMNRSAEQIVREPIRGSRNVFVLRSDSFPLEPRTRHSFLNYRLLLILMKFRVNSCNTCKSKSVRHWSHSGRVCLQGQVTVYMRTNFFYTQFHVQIWISRLIFLQTKFHLQTISLSICFIYSSGCFEESSFHSFTMNSKTETLVFAKITASRLHKIPTFPN